MKCREWWRNCATQPDDEIIAIDQFENQITPLTPGVAATRELISTFEVCHHKAERWVDNIIEAIAAGTTIKGLGTRKHGPPHPAEELWLRVCHALSAWCEGNQGTGLTRVGEGVPAAHLIDLLGAPSPRKIWQVRRVIARIRSVAESAGAKGGDASGFSWLLYSENPDRPFGGSRCPSVYKDAEQFWLATVCTMLEDTHNSTPVVLSLGLAIDMLWPCHWNFLKNLEIVLGAIGGNLRPNAPFTACGRNIRLLPARSRLLGVARTLGAYARGALQDASLDPSMLDRLGSASKPKIWLAASLDKTLRLQLDPPDELERLYRLSCPAWVESADPDSLELRG